MTLPNVVAGQVARAAEQNALIATVNSHTGTLNDAGVTLASQGSRITALEERPSGGTSAGTYIGQWTDNNAGSAGLSFTTGATVAGTPSGAGMKVVDIGVPVGTPVGCTMNAGTFTPSYAGKWAFFAGVQYQGSNTAVRALYLAVSSAANSPSGVRYGLVGGPTMDAQSTSAVVTLTAGQAVSIYVALWTANSNLTVWRAQGNLFTAVWLGP